MSAFLGHIHYWLYHKIRRVAEREQMIYEKAEAMCGPTAEELRAQVAQTYGEPLPDVDLAELIDQTNIHGWLQRQINVAETREASFIKELLEMCDSGGREVVEQAYAEHGTHCGKHAQAQGKYQPDTAGGIYKALQDYYLNGMPCDQVDMVVENTPEKVVWEGDVCLQEGNWKRAGVSAQAMKGFYQKWLAGFVQGINPAFTLTQTGDTLKGEPVNRYEIFK
jgi:hypothetical protein